MAEFVEMDFAPDNILDYKTLNKIAQNQQYLYDELYTKPRGMLALVQTTSAYSCPVDDTSTPVTGLSINFTIEENRYYKVGFQCGNVTTPSASNRLIIAICVDNIIVAGFVSDMCAPSSFIGVQSFYQLITEPLTPGTHLLHVSGITALNTGDYFQLQADGNSPMRLWIEDAGGF